MMTEDALLAIARNAGLEEPYTIKIEEGRARLDVKCRSLTYPLLRAYAEAYSTEDIHVWAGCCDRCGWDFTIMVHW